MIIDCHCHAGKGDGLTGPWDTAAPLSRYLRRCTRAGIGRSVLMPAFHSDYSWANREIARMIRARPGRFYGFAFVNAIADRGRIHSMIREAVNLGLHGIKVHRHDARISREICDAARDYRLPVLYDVMGEVAPVELLASEYPEVSFVIPHLGSFADDWAAQSTLIPLLARFPNLYTDTSGVRRFDLLQRAVHTAGSAKILFGSDGPWLHPGVELAKIRALRLPPADEDKILGENLLGLIRKRASSPCGR